VIKPKKDDNQMSKNFLHPKDDDFCLHIRKYVKRELKFYYKLLNLDNNQVQEDYLDKNENENGIEINIGFLQAGNYQITIKNVSKDVILGVELCMVNFRLIVS
jgi:hypothetical protein